MKIKYQNSKNKPAAELKQHIFAILTVFLIGGTNVQSIAQPSGAPTVQVQGRQDLSVQGGITDEEIMTATLILKSEKCSTNRHQVMVGMMNTAQNRTNIFSAPLKSIIMLDSGATHIQDIASLFPQIKTNPFWNDAFKITKRAELAVLPNTVSDAVAFHYQEEYVNPPIFSPVKTIGNITFYRYNPPPDSSLVTSNIPR